MTDRSPSEGWITFSALILGVAGVVNAAVGLLAMYNIGPFGAENVPVSIYGWGLTLLVFGAASVLAGVFVNRRSSLGRIGGIILASFSLFMWALWLGAYPTAALIVIVLDVLVLFGLSVTRDAFA